VIRELPPEGGREAAVVQIAELFGLEAKEELARPRSPSRLALDVAQPGPEVPRVARLVVAAEPAVVRGPRGRAAVGEIQPQKEGERPGLLLVVLSLGGLRVEAERAQQVPAKAVAHLLDGQARTLVLELPGEAPRGPPPELGGELPQSFLHGGVRDEPVHGGERARTPSRYGRSKPFRETTGARPLQRLA